MKEHKHILSVNTGFFVNRYTDPAQWVHQVSEVIGLKNVQFTADLINPYLPDELIDKQITKTTKELSKYGVNVTSSFTGAFTRLNNLTHPEEAFRNYYENWFYRFVDISAALGSASIGSHFGILTQPNLEDKSANKFLTNDAISRWCRIADYAAKKGINKIFWEPMSISREYGETIEKAINLNDALNDSLKEKSDIKFSMCLDVDHGDLESLNPDDIDPYAWLKKCGSNYDMVHLKQSYENKGGHWPFTTEHNLKGKIVPHKVLEAIRSTNPREVELVLELSFKERQPADRLAVKHVAESVEYWLKSI